MNRAERRRALRAGQHTIPFLLRAARFIRTAGCSFPGCRCAPGPDAAGEMLLSFLHDHRETANFAELDWFCGCHTPEEALRALRN
jgi:hypothetical protein